MYNPLLLIDFYKACHAEQYPAGMTKIYSPGTPRLSRLPMLMKWYILADRAFQRNTLSRHFPKLSSLFQKKKL